MAIRANIELDTGAKTFATGLVIELIAGLRRIRPGDLMAVVGSDGMVGSELEAWCRFTRNSLVDVTLEEGRYRWVIRCGEAPAEAHGEAPSEAHRSLGSRLWLYTNFDCNLRCDYCCVRSSPKAPRRALGLLRVRRIASEAAALGVREIFVTGGEPFLLADIGGILAACTATAPTTVLTNGMLLVGRRLDTLRGLPRDRLTLQISLDSSTPERHDQHRGAGTWAKAWRGIERARAFVCALIATAFWPLLGYALGRRFLPRVLAIGAAPVIGWAVHSAVTLPIYLLFGFSSFLVAGIGAVCVLLAGFSLSQPSSVGEAEPALTIPLGAAAVAAAVALIPAATILPKSSGDAVWLADATFDHAKSAIIDAMTRLGLPPVNPVFSEAGAPGHLAYYYLWHFSAAEIALVTSMSGWEADIGLTWFTAFASLSLMMGLAVWLSKRTTAAVWVVALAAAGSLWVTLYWTFHAKSLAPVLLRPIGLAGWLFQATWVPQHLMAASCVVTAMLLVTRYALQQTLVLVLIIAMLIVAGFESSTFVGGITFAFASLIAAPMLFVAADSKRRLHFVGGLAVAALLVVFLITPFVRDQLTTIHARGGGNPFVIAPYKVFGEQFPVWLRRILDVPGYWLIILPVELPATFIAGMIALGAALRSAMPRSEILAITVFACLASAGLIISWLLVLTLGDNNDLGLRAVLPAEIVLIVITAAGIAGLPGVSLRAPIVATALAGIALSMPDFIQTIHDNILSPQQPPDAKVFAQTPDLWAAARRHAAPAARIANNPLFLKDLTPWPVNISWALLSNRSSCFAGREMAVPFAPLSPQLRSQVDAEFLRVFDGNGTPNDVQDLAMKYGCDVIVLVPQDKAWEQDPFAAGSNYRLAEERNGRWRIYVRRK